ncbi:hypothetical protein ACXR2T_06290 [Leucobacter sp. HY1910]
MRAMHQLSNGWTIEERDSSRSAFIGPDAIHDGYARFTARLVRIPSKKLVRVLHYLNTTDEEKARSLRSAAKIARGKARNLPWQRSRAKNSRAWVFGVTLGDHINEAQEFERISRELTTGALIGAETIGGAL